MAKKSKSKAATYDDDPEEEGEWEEDAEPNERAEPVLAQDPAAAADEPPAPPSVSPEHAEQQKLAQKAPEGAEQLAHFEGHGRVAESAVKAFEEEQRAGKEAIADAERREAGAGETKEDGK